MLVNGSLAVGILASLRFRITCFSAVGITNSRFSLSRIRKFGRTGRGRAQRGAGKAQKRIEKIPYLHIVLTKNSNFASSNIGITSENGKITRRKTSEWLLSVLE